MSDQVLLNKFNELRVMYTLRCFAGHLVAFPQRFNKFNIILKNYIAFAIFQIYPSFEHPRL